MNELTEKIKTAETELGRPLSAIERLNITRSMPDKDDTAERMEIILKETFEGIEALNNFHTEIEKANLVNNGHMRHVAAIEFESTKRSLLKQFNEGKIERIGKQQ